MRPRFLARLDEGLRGFAGEIEKNLARHQIYGLDKFVPCIIPPKGDSRIAQAVDVRGMACKLARLRSVPARLYEQRRNQIIEKSVEEIKLKAGPVVRHEEEEEISVRFGNFYDKVRRLTEVDFEIQEEKLAEEFANIVKPKLVSRLVNLFPKSSAETGHFQGGVKLPPRRFAPLR